MSTAKRFGAYHRVSDANGRDLADESTLTDKVAFEQIDAWAKTRPGIEVPAEHRYLDWDTTGSTMQRPALDRMLADLEAGLIDGVVVAQVDRLSRADVGDALTVIKQLVGDDDKRPRPLVLLDLGIDPSTEFGEFGLTVLLALARMQWRRYQRQWATHRGKAVDRGVWVGPAPVGYLRDERGALALDGAVAPVIEHAFKVAAADGQHAAGEYLRAELPDMHWRASDVRRVLSNRAYLGEHHDDGAPHAPITTLATWEAAQKAPRARRSNGDYPLMHVATCANCGAGLVGALQTVRGVKYRRMRCSAVCQGGVGSVSADKLEALVRDELRAVLSDGGLGLGYDQGELRAAEDALEAAQAERRRFAQDPHAHDLLGDDDWQAGLRARADAVTQARELIQSLASQAAETAELPAADQLDDPAKFKQALVVIGSLVVAPGRGPVDLVERGGRVALDWKMRDDFHDGAGVLAS